MNHTQQIAAGVKAELARTGKRSADLAVAEGMSRQTLASRLNGEKPFSTDEIDIAAQFLNLTFIELIRRSLNPSQGDA